MNNTAMRGTSDGRRIVFKLKRIWNATKLKGWKNMKIKFFQMLLVSFIFAIMVAACGSESNTSSESTGNTPAPTDNSAAVTPQPTVKPAEETWDQHAEVTIWNASDAHIEAIAKQFPNYTIKSLKAGQGTQLPDLVAARTPVDIYVGSIAAINNPSHLLAMDMQYDMTDLARKHGVDLTRFEPAMLDAVKNFGGLYGLPVDNNLMVLFYNKDIFDRLGVPYPEDDMTWDQAIELSKKMTVESGGVQYIGFNTSIGHYLNVNQYTLPYVDPKTNTAPINNDAYKKMLSTIPLGMMQAPGFTPWIENNENNIPDPNKSFKSEKNVAMLAFFINGIKNDDMQAMNFDLVALPTMADKPGIGSQSYPTYFAVTSTSKVKDQAMEIIKYITSDEYQMALSKSGLSLPVLKSNAIKEAYGSEAAWKDKNLQAVFKHEIATGIFRTPYDNQVQAEIIKVLPGVIMGQTDINTALRNAEDAANTVLANLTKK